MSDLTFLVPAVSFPSLLNTLSTGGLTNILQVIQDGLGHNSPLSLSTDSININTQMGGGFFIDNVKLDATAEDINVVCLFADFGGLMGALTLPIGTTGERPDPPTNGDIRYNSDNQSFEGYQAGIWADFGTTDAYTPGNPTYLQDTHGTTNNLSVGTPAPTFLGQENTTFGIGAGTFVGTFNNSTFLGYNANPDTNNLNNACSIGRNSVVSVSNAIVLGDATAPTKVGIGTTSPTKILHVANGDAVFEGQLGAGTTTPSARLHVKDGASYFQNSNVGIGVAVPLEPLHVVGNSAFVGNLGIGLTNPTLPLHVVGDSYFNGKVGVGRTPHALHDIPDSALTVFGTAKFQGGPGGFDTRSALIKGQELRTDEANVGVTIDFSLDDIVLPIPLAMQLVVKVLISAIAISLSGEDTYYSASGESRCAALRITDVGIGPSIVTVGASPASFSYSSPTRFAPIGTWSISGNNLRLSISNSVIADLRANYVVSYERFYATSDDD